MLTMGEVRVKVKLSNSLDAMLARTGRLAVDEVRTFEGDAMVDTGAVRCCIPESVRDQLGLELATQASAVYADGRSEVVSVTDPFNIEILGRREAETALVLGDEILIGQTVLEKMDLLVDCPRQRLITNPAHPQGPVNKVK